MNQLTIPTKQLHDSLASVRGGIARTVDAYRSRRTLAAFATLLCVCTFGAIIDHVLSFFISPATLWLSSGIALAMLFFEGFAIWPAIVLGTGAAQLWLGVPPEVALGFALANTLQAVVGAFILRRADFSPLLSQLRDVIILILVAMLTTMISPTLGYTVLYLSGNAVHPLAAVWGPWWLGNILSSLVLAPLILRWAPNWPRRTAVQWAEWTAAFGLLIVLSYIAFWTPVGEIAGIPLIYTILFPLIWMALSIGPRSVTLALFVMTALSISGVFLGQQESAALMGTRLVQIELLDVVLTIIFLTFVSSEEGRKNASRSLEEYVVQLEEAVLRVNAADRAKNEFLAILAHELRNPLAPILSSLELLQARGADSAGSERLLAAMEDRVRTLARLLDDLLDISRISQKKFKLQRETIDLNNILERSADNARSLMQSKNHALLISLASEPIWISSDPVRLEQVVTNLLNNAAKYTPQNGTIMLTSGMQAGKVEVRVRDNGIGIPKEMLGHIFEPFLQVDSSRRSEGLGIGLSLAKRLVEMHNGTIEARSDGLSHGSEFLIRLPKPALVQLPIPALSRIRTRAARAPSRTFSILLVDDNTLAAESLGKLLSHKGHAVTLAHDAVAALHFAQTLAPEVIVLDIGLPDMDGYSVARELREHKNGAFLIALTGFGQEEDKRKALDAGFDHHLTKPAGIAEVESVLASIDMNRERFIAHPA